MTDPRICIVGAGALSSRRIYPYIGLAGGELVGVCDLELPKAEEKARRFGGTAYSDIDTMLDQEKPDGVIICIGPEQHAVLAPQVLRRGIPVYTEKPPAPTAEAAYEVVQTARETGVLCMTAFKKRYAAVYQRAREWLDGFNGEDYYSISVDYASGPYSNQSPRSYFLLDFGIHWIDVIGFLFGDVAQVFAFSKDAHSYAVSLQFVNGAVGTMNLTDGRSFRVPTEEVEITLHGGNFMTIRNSSSWRITENEKPVEWREPLTFISAGDSGHDTGHLAEIETFFKLVQQGQGTPPSNIYASYKSMVLYEAIDTAANTGKLVDVHYNP